MNERFEEVKMGPGVQPAMTASQENLQERRTGSTGSPVTGEVKSRVQPMFDERKKRLANRLKDTADVLRETGSKMEEKNQIRGSEYALKAADRLHDYSNYLEHHSVDAIMRDVQDFSRERPWLIMGGAFILGATVARFMKASRES